MRLGGDCVSNYTSYFDLYESLNDVGLHCDKPNITEEKHYSDAELLAELNSLLECIQTLDDYTQLVQILRNLANKLTLRFIFIFYQALVTVEIRLFKTVDMYPPMEDFMDQKIDLLLDRYEDFCYEYEKLIVDWARQNHYDTDPVKWDFIVKRNKIYADYSVLAGTIIGVFSET